VPLCPHCQHPRCNRCTAKKVVDRKHTAASSIHLRDSVRVVQGLLRSLTPGSRIVQNDSESDDKTRCFWKGLSQSEKEACFDARKPPAISLGSKKAWEIEGILLDGWNTRVLPKLVEVSSHQSIRAILYKDVVDVSIPIVWSCFLVAAEPSHELLQPTVIARAEIETLARNAARYLKELQKGSLKDLLGEFEITYATLQVSLCNDDNTSGKAEAIPRMPSFNDPEAGRSICGARVTISSTNQEYGQQRSCATIGGTLIISGRYYGVTAAHAFPQLTQNQTRAAKLRTSGDTHGTENLKGYTTDLSECEVSIDTGREFNVKGVPSDLGSVQDPQREFVINSKVLSNEKNSTESCDHITCNRQSDWALVPVTNERFQVGNSVKLPSGEYIRLRAVGKKAPRKEVIAVSGVSGIHTGRFAQSSSIILLPGSDQMQTVWRFRGSSQLGDCGSWVIGRNGTAYAMIIATESYSRETFCLPLSDIVGEIRNHFVEMAVPPRRPYFAHRQYNNIFDFRWRRHWGMNSFL
jgi:hypothetical protein